MNATSSGCDVATPGAGLRLRQRRLVVGDQLAGAERRAGAHAQYRPQLGQFAQELLHVVGVDDHRSCAGVVAHVGDLVGSQPDVHRHRDQPGLCQTERDLRPFKAIAGDHHHPIARYQPPADQEGGESTGPLVDLRPGQRPIGVDERTLVGVAAGVVGCDVTDEHQIRRPFKSGKPVFRPVRPRRSGARSCGSAAGHPATGGSCGEPGQPRSVGVDDIRTAQSWIPP